MGNAVPFCASAAINEIPKLDISSGDSINKAHAIGKNKEVDANKKEEVDAAVENESTDIHHQFKSIEVSEIQETFLALERMPFTADQDTCFTGFETPKKLSDLCIEAIVKSEGLDREDVMIPELEDLSFPMDNNFNFPSTILQENNLSERTNQVGPTADVDESLLLQHFLSMLYSLSKSSNNPNPFPSVPYNYLDMLHTENGNFMDTYYDHYYCYQEESDVHNLVDDILYLMDNYSQDVGHDSRQVESGCLEQLTSELMLPNREELDSHSQRHFMHISSDDTATSGINSSQVLALANTNSGLTHNDHDMRDIGQSMYDCGLSIAAAEDFPWSRENILSYLKHGTTQIASRELSFGIYFSNHFLHNAINDDLPFIEEYSKMLIQENLRFKSSAWDPTNSIWSFYQSLDSIDSQNILNSESSLTEQKKSRGVLTKVTKHRRQGRRRRNKRRRASLSDPLSISKEELKKLKLTTSSDIKLQEVQQHSSSKESSNKSGICNESETQICLLADSKVSAPSQILSDIKEIEESSNDEADIPIPSIRDFPASYQEAALAVSEVKAYFLMRSLRSRIDLMPAECPLNIQHCMCSKIYLEAENTPDANIEMISKPLNTSPVSGLFPMPFDSMIDRSLAGSGELRCNSFENLVFEGQEIPENEIPPYILYYMELGVVPWKWKTKLSFSQIISDSFIPLEVRKPYVQKFGWCPSSYDKLYCFEGHSKYLFSYKLLGCWECMRKHFNCLYKWCSNSRLIDCGDSKNIKK